jgi:hypothetical protein
MKSRVAIINFSGNVGKSTIARHLLVPRMDNADIVSVESINSDDHNTEAMRGKQFGLVIERIMMRKSVVVDVGSSNIEEFISQMRLYDDSHEDFNYIVIPVVPDLKQQRDTIKTIQTLSALGFPAEKLRMLFNMIDISDQPEQVFAGLFRYHKDQGNFTINPDASLHKSDVYSLIGPIGKTVRELATDMTDFDEKIIETEDDEEKRHWIHLRSVRKLARVVEKEHNRVFPVLFS